MIDRSVEIEKFGKIIVKTWSQDTSSVPDEWLLENPAIGQCAVTALLFQDYFGGEIVCTKVNVGDRLVSHYYNILETEKYDFTKDQFSPGIAIPEGIPKTKDFNSTRDYCLSFPQTKRRYLLLRSLFEEKMSLA